MEKLSPRFMNWASILEDNTREQAERTSRMPFVFPHLLQRADVRCDLPSLRHSIERGIPLSTGHENRKLTGTAEARVAELDAEAEHAGFDPASYAGNWRLHWARSDRARNRSC